MAFKVVNENNIKDFKNFTYNEIKCKCKGKYCNGYPAGFSYELLKQLQKIRNHFGKPVIITSAVRCNQHNKNVGGISNSRHKEGKAVDFYVKGVSYSKLNSYVNSMPYKHYKYNINGSVMHYDITPPEYVEKYNLTRLLKPGCRGEDVKNLQKELKKMGYDLGKYGVDGIFGKSTSYTSKAVKSFQKANRLYADGKVGKNTAHKLGWLYKGK